MFLTALTREGGAEGGGMRPEAVPLGALLRPSSLDGREGFCDEDVCWRAAAACVMTCFAREESLDGFLKLASWRDRSALGARLSRVSR